MSNPVIAATDVTNFAQEFLAIDMVNAGSLETQLGVMNGYADNFVASPPFPNMPKAGNTVAPIFQAKLLVICHFLKLLNFNTEGKVTLDKVGDLQAQYAILADMTEEWDQTIYGSLYKRLRRIYAPGISASPTAGRPPFPVRGSGPNFG
jgi:hypothetical protein